MTKIAPFLAGCVAALALNLANAGPAPEDLTGTYAQNAPCKSDGTDPADILVKISPEGIDSRVSTCKFQKVKQEGYQIDARLECSFRSGPLMGDVTFTLKPNNTVALIDKDKNYQAVLYRCSKRTGASE